MLEWNKRPASLPKLAQRFIPKLDEWAEFVAAAISSFGGSVTIRRDTHVFDNDGKIITRVNLDTMKPMDVAKIDKKIVDLINELREEGRF